MNRLVRRSSLLTATALIAACASHQQDPERDAEKPGSQVRADAPAGANGRQEEVDAALDEIVVTGAKAQRRPARNVAAAMEVEAKAASPVALACCIAQAYQPTKTEQYEHQTDNPVHRTAEEPVSTFSIDVDTGAYANVRRFLNAGSCRRRMRCASRR